MHDRVIAAALAAALLLAGCAGAERASRPGAARQETAGGTPATTPAGAKPVGTAAPTAPEAEVAVGATSSTAYLVRSFDTGLFVEPVTRALPEPTLAVARAAMDGVVNGHASPGLQTMAPDGTSVLGVDIDGALLTVDLSAAVRRGAGGSASELAFAQQLAHTAAQFEGVEAVRLRVEGQPVTDLWGHVDWSQPVRPDPAALSPITITSPSWGATVDAGPVTVGGKANVFEATVQLRLVDPVGRVVEEAFATATCGTGCRGAWEHTFSTPATAPGTWAVEAYEENAGYPEEGPPERFETRVQFVVG